MALLRTAQEALVNAAKHAPGQRVSVRLDYGGDDVSLTVVNDLPGDGTGTGTGPRRPHGALSPYRRRRLRADRHAGASPAAERDAGDRPPGRALGRRRRAAAGHAVPVGATRRRAASARAGVVTDPGSGPAARGHRRRPGQRARGPGPAARRPARHRGGRARPPTASRPWPRWPSSTPTPSCSTCTCPYWTASAPPAGWPPSTPRVAIVVLTTYVDDTQRAGGAAGRRAQLPDQGRRPHRHRPRPAGRRGGLTVFDPARARHPAGRHRRRPSRLQAGAPVPRAARYPTA